ncbi:MAG: cytidylate kinase-like family protein [Pseudonocardia sp.]|nr:cytidylate kinase-like family protein [Pseudonocardia sp.]
MYVVTLSAAFGTGGGVVGPAVAERLGVPFIDRAIPTAVAEALGVPVEHVLSRDEQVKGWLSRLLASAVPLSMEYMTGEGPPRISLLRDTEVAAHTRNAIHKIISEQGGVILGRAATIVLREHPTALHVRLCGDPERRVRQAMDILRITEREAREAMNRIDNAMAAYVQHCYNADHTNTKHYHLILDSTRLPLTTCTDIIVSTAKSGPPPR